MAIAKVVAVPGGAAGSSSPAEGILVKSCPTLWEYLADTKYEDGTARVTATFTVFVEFNQVKVCLSDRDTGRTAWGSASSLEDALGVLEARLGEGSTEWREKGGTRAKGKK